MKMLNNCCCCVKLRPGAIVIASLDIFAAIVALVIGILGTITFLVYGNFGGIFIGMYFALACLISAISGSCLLGGAINRSAIATMIHMIFSLIGLGLSVLSLLGLIVLFFFLPRSSVVPFIFLLLNVIGHAIGIPLKVYFLLCVYSFYKKLNPLISNQSLRLPNIGRSVDTTGKAMENAILTAPEDENPDYDGIEPEDVPLNGGKAV